MAPKRGTLARLLVNQFDFSSQSNKVEVGLSTGRVESTVLQSTAAETTATNASGSIIQNGYFLDKAAGQIEQELQSEIENGTLLLVAALFGTDVAACPAYVARDAQAESMKLSAPVEGVLQMSGAWHQGVGIVRGLRAYAGTISAIGAQTHIDLGAAGAAGGYAWLFVQSITGAATDASIIVESDDNTGFTTPATECTFTFSAVGGFEQAMSGAIDRYVRLKTNSMGGATNFTVVLVVAASGITY